MIKIVFACNDGYMDGLYLSILSIIKRTKQPISFNVLSADYSEYKSNYVLVSKKNEKILDSLVKKYNKKSSVKVIDCTNLAKKLLTSEKNTNRKKFSPYSNLRLLIDQYKQFDDKVLYLDCDIMANDDIKQIWDVDLKDSEICVCHNWWARHLLKKDSFNAGVILFNMKRILELKSLEQARKYFNEKYYIWADQTVLYKAIKNKMFFPNDEYRFNYQKNTIQKDTILKHFCACPYHWPKHYNIKQFQVDEVHKYLKIHVFDEDFKIWQKAKEEWKK